MVLICIILVVAFTGLSARLVYVQVVRHDEYAERAMEQRSRNVVLPAYRGRIFDTNGDLLVDNFPTKDVIITKQGVRNLDRNCVRGLAHAEGLRPKAMRSLYADEDIRQRYADRLATLIADVLGEEAGEKVRAIAKVDSKREEVRLANKVDHDVATELAAILKEEKLGGIYFEDSMKRFYPNPNTLGEVLGSVKITGEGTGGVEGMLNEHLSGVDGSRWVERDGDQNEISVHPGEVIEPIDGRDVFLTLDMSIQNMAERAADKVFETHRPEKVTVIFCDPTTGEILTMVSRTSSGHGNGERVWRNICIADQYEPGSTMKVITLAACYEKGVIHPRELINCHNGVYYEPGFKPFHDHHPYAFKTPGMVLAKSSNIGTYMMAKRLEEGDLHEIHLKFGLGSRTGIALVGEAQGSIYGPSSPHWSKTSLRATSIGYEVGVTPLQMLNAMCVIANGGKLMQPKIVSKIIDSRGQPVYTFSPEEIGDVVSAETADQVNRDMQLVPGSEGTGKLGNVDGYATAAKTGTARKLHPDGYYMKGRYVVSYMGFLPAENPRLAGIVIVDDPRGEGSRYGGTVAGPVFKEIASQVMDYWRVEPSAVRRQAIRSKGPVAVRQ